MFDSDVWKKRQYKHTQRRINERYDLTIGPKGYEFLNEKIRNKEAFYCCLYRRNTRFAIWIVEFKGREILVGYDIIHKNIATALSPGNIECYRARAGKLEARFEKIKSRPTTKPKKRLLHTAIRARCPLCLKEKKRKKKFCSKCNEAFNVVERFGLARIKRVVEHEASKESMFDTFINWMV